MSGNGISERYGLRPIPVPARHRVVKFYGKPLTDEKIKYNDEVKRIIEFAEDYNKLLQNLVDTLDDKVFIADTLWLVTSPTVGEELHSPRNNLVYDNADDGLSLSEKKRKIEIRLADARLTLPTDIKILKRLNTAFLGQGFHEVNSPESDTPSVFYRAFRPSCYSRYDADLGFRSSRQPLTTACHHEGTLCDSLLVNEEVLRTHCERSQPSDLIAMSDSPARILRIVARWGQGNDRGDMIAVINPSKLLAFKVLFNRTTTLAEELGVRLWAKDRETGLQWANENYWVAYRWIPAECVEFCISPASLRRACEKHKIGRYDYAKRLSLEELLPVKMEQLSL